MWLYPNMVVPLCRQELSIKSLDDAMNNQKEYSSSHSKSAQIDDPGLMIYIKLGQ